MGLFTKLTYNQGDTYCRPGFVADQITKLNTALGTGRDYFALTLHVEAQTDGAVLNTAVQDVVTVPVACTLVGVSFMAGAVSTNDSTVDVFNQTSGATVLSAPKTLAAANTKYAGTIAAASIAAGDNLTLRFVIGGGKNITNVSATMLFKIALVESVPTVTAPSSSEFLDAATYKSIMEDVETGFDSTTDYYALTLEKVAATGQPVANTAIQDSVICPYAGTITNVRYVCVNWTTGTTTTVDLWNQTGTPATVLSAPIAVTGDLTAASGTIASATVAANDVLTMRYVVSGGSSTLDGGKMTVLIKKVLST